MSAPAAMPTIPSILARSERSSRLSSLGVENAGSLPYASTLCGACYDVCPVKINIPEVLIHLRGEVVRHKQDHAGIIPDPENLAMQMLARVFASPSRYEQMQRLGRFGQRLLVRNGVVTSLPGPLGGWTAVRDVYPVASQTFREWWRERKPEKKGATEKPS